MGNVRTDETGNEYGGLVVEAYHKTRATPNGTKKTVWRCRCRCGRVCYVSGGDLRRKHGTRSCAPCSRLKHGHAAASGCSREYSCYRSMLGRCRRNKRYRRKGIEVCSRWRGEDGFLHFLKDMGPCPSPEYTIDRIDNAGGYSPHNCRWATRKQQMQNTDVNVRVTLAGNAGRWGNGSESGGFPPGRTTPGFGLE